LDDWKNVPEGGSKSFVALEVLTLQAWALVHEAVFSQGYRPSPFSEDGHLLGRLNVSISKAYEVHWAIRISGKSTR
jgi:hypothetical protein